MLLQGVYPGCDLGGNIRHMHHVQHAPSRRARHGFNGLVDFGTLCVELCCFGNGPLGSILFLLLTRLVGQS